MQDWKKRHDREMQGWKMRDKSKMVETVVVVVVAVVYKVTVQ